MELLEQLLNWIAENESALSGIAAVFAIAAVVIAVGMRVFRFVAGDKAIDETSSVRRDNNHETRQVEVRYTQTEDGKRIAWAKTGNGVPLVRSLGWFTHLEFESTSRATSPFWNRMAENFQLVRYDGRGMGMSDRDAEWFDADTRLQDLACVIDAAGVDKVAIMGLSEGGPTAIRYAVENPERVSHLVLWGSFLKAPDLSEIPQFVSVAAQSRKYWGSKDGPYHQMFTSFFVPEGNAEQNKAFNEMQRRSATADVASKFLVSIGQVDVTDIASQVNIPTLVLHRRGDMVAPLSSGQDIAATIPGAQMVVLEGSNHWMMCEAEDMDHVVGLIEDFILKC